MPKDFTVPPRQASTGPLARPVLDRYRKRVQNAKRTRAVKILVREAKLLTAAYQRVPTRPASVRKQAPKRPSPEGSPIRWPSPIPRMLSPIPDTPPHQPVPDDVPERDESTSAPTALGDFIQGHPNPDHWEPWTVEALRALRPQGVGGRVRRKLPVSGGGWVRVTLPKP